MIRETVLNILKYNIFDNSIQSYIIFLLVLFLSYPTSVLTSYILKNYFTKISSKTSIKFDDIFVESLSPTITMFVIASFFYIATSYMVGELRLILNKIFSFLIVVPLVYFMIKFSTEMLSYYLKKNSLDKNRKINETAINLTIQITRIILISLGILLILENLGYNVSTLIAGLGVGGFAFALAAQDLLKNFFAGLGLIFDKTFLKGERINFNDKSGIIEEIKLRNTKIRTYDGSLLTIPNSMLADNIVENVTKVPKVKVKMTIGVTYDTSSKKLKLAKELIQEAIKENKYADENSTTIFFESFGDFSLNIKVYYYAKFLTMDNWYERVSMQDEVNFAIKEKFEKANIEIAFPTQTIELKRTK